MTSSSGFERTRPLVLAAVAAVALAIFAMIEPGILSTASLSSVAVFGVEIGIIALAQSFVICGGGTGIDISVGAIAALSQVVLGWLMVSGISWPLAICLGLLVGLVCGAFNAAMITLVRIPPFIATLSTLFAFQGLALVITGGVDIDLSAMPTGFLAIGQGKIAGFPVQILIYIVVLAVFAFVQHRTNFGRRLYLTGTNERAAVLAGLRRGRLRATCYIVAGGASALAAVINAARLGVARPDTLDNANLVSIAAVVLGGTAIFGGTGSVVGTALATVVIAVIDYGLSYSNVNSIYQAGAIGIILILVMFSETAIRFIPRFSGSKT